MIVTSGAKKIISVLENAGYEAFAVGGCVRDFIMQRHCDDIDIATSAKPFESEKVFKDNDIKFIETGLKHGTITAIIDGSTYEVTTYRSDGDYKDSRHPENVEFVTDISQDLSRRDFTINAIAYNDNAGFVDLFGGKNDINNKIIRAVGDPDTRFKEDALRIMRAIRFSSVLSFDIEIETKKAVFKNKELLKNISAERIFAELSKLLMGDNVFDVLMNYRDIIAVIIPELEPVFDVEQNVKWHIYDVWEHTCKAVEQSPKDLSLRLTMLFHDIGKAFAKTTDENGVDHFKGHAKISGVYAKTALNRFKVSNEIYNRVMFLVPNHDEHLSTECKKIKRLLSKIGESNFRDLIDVRRADILGKNLSLIGEELENLDVTLNELDRIISDGEAFTIKELTVNGNDMMLLGLKGSEIGDALSILLEKVIDEELPNERKALLSFFKDNN